MPPSPNLRYPIGTTVTPGDRLALVATKNMTLFAGNGTYIRQGHLYASLLGTVCANATTTAATTTATAAAGAGQEEECSSRQENNISWIISIQPSHSTITGTTCPKVNMIILGRITRVILPTHAMVDIVAIVPDENSTSNNDHHESSMLEAPTSPSSSSSPPQPKPFIIPLIEPYSGILRQQDLRPKSSLEIRIDDCYQSGDVILARILANGERDYILSTAEAELGVIQAVCEKSGYRMQPVSWKEMRCPISLVKEGRKVAKPRRR